MTSTYTFTHSESRAIRVRARYEGFHHWADAPDEVAFLRDNHRHEFHVNVLMQVKHHDREVEFILVKRWLEDKVLAVFAEMQNVGSCEQQAEVIARDLRLKYGNDRYISVEVSEDGENGGVYIYTPPTEE